jgi:hypothetical protein
VGCLASTVVRAALLETGAASTSARTPGRLDSVRGGHRGVLRGMIGGW